MSFVLAILDFFSGLFSLIRGSKDRQIGAQSEKIDNLTAALKADQAMNEAAAQSPTDKDSLIAALKQGKVAIIFLALFLCACASQPVVVCPTPRPWTDNQENEIAANLAVLPPDSPLIAVGVEWAKLRAEANACIGAQNGSR